MIHSVGHAGIGVKAHKSAGTHVVKAHSADETAEAIAERLASEGAI